MKQIDGEIVVGSIRSRKRYEHAPAMCESCYIHAPVDMPLQVSCALIGVKTPCYVCEEEKYLFKVAR